MIDQLPRLKLTELQYNDSYSVLRRKMALSATYIQTVANVT